MGIRIGDGLLVSGDERRRRITLEKLADLDAIAGSSHIEDADTFMREIRRLWRRWRLK